MSDKVLHCWQGENDENEVGSDEWVEIFLRGEDVCLLPFKHEGPHVFTPPDEILISFPPFEEGL